MPANTMTDAALTLTLDGTAVECQVVNATFTPAAPGESTPVPIACGDTVSEPGDPSNGSITGEVLKDWGANGVTRLLAEAATSGAEMDYTYTENDGTSDVATWTGKCTVPAPSIDFRPSKMGRHAFALTLTTSVLAPVT